MWHLTTISSSAAELHALEPGDSPGRAVWVLEPTRPAVVLGSTQDPTIIDPDAALRGGSDVVRRRSGGSAVLLVPGWSTWLDLLIDRDDDLAEDDVSASFGWLGSAWCAALRQLGFDADVRRDPLEQNEWSRLACFASIGPGEVLVDGRKAVGISQRRTRRWIRYQCLVQHRVAETELFGMLDLTETDRQRAVDETRVAAVDVDPAELVRTLVAFLPDQ